MSLIRHDDKYYVVVTHQPDIYTSKKNYCSIGIVDAEEKVINYWSNLSFPCAALKLRVSTSNGGTVVIAHEKFYSSHCLCYHIGTLRFESGG